MIKVRQDAWSHEDDLLLAETVLRHIREGSTQLNAFEEVGDELNRTSAACGFRWNAEIRTKYDSAVDLAKRQRKEKKRAMKSVNQETIQPTISTPTVLNDSQTIGNYDSSHTMDSVIRYLTELKVNLNETNQSKLSIKHLKAENESLHKNIEELEKNLAKTKKELQTIQEDYQTFITIMERARKMTVLDEDRTYQGPKFKMDKNGNLEQVAQSPN